MPLLIDPIPGFKDQLSTAFEVPFTTGWKTVLCPPVSDALLGVKLTDTFAGFKVTVTDAVLLGSAWLIAINVTVSGEEMLVGEVYSPLNMVPKFGVSDQLTPVFAAPLTLAVYCADCPAVSAVGPGAIEMLTGEIGCPNSTVAVPVSPAFVRLVADIVTSAS